MMMERVPAVLSRLPVSGLLISSEILLRLFSLHTAVSLADRTHAAFLAPFLRFSSLDALRARAMRMLTGDPEALWGGSSCLRRSMALRLLYGRAAPIHIGVRRSGESRIEAHAWVRAAGVSDSAAEKFEILGVL